MRIIELILKIIQEIFLKISSFFNKTIKRSILTKTLLLILMYNYFKYKELIIEIIQRTTYTRYYLYTKILFKHIKYLGLILNYISLILLIIIFICSCIADIIQIKNIISNKKRDIKEELTILIPCYNEHDKIEETIDTLLEIIKRSKTKIKIILINDGSKDYEEKYQNKKIRYNRNEKKFNTIFSKKENRNNIDLLKYYVKQSDLNNISNIKSLTLIKIIKKLKLEKTNIEYSKKLKTKKINNIYTNKNNNILLIDKENGGKYDALNCGINFCTTKWVMVLDADTILGMNTIDDCMKYANDNVDIIYPPIIPKMKEKRLLIIAQFFNYISSFYIVRQGMLLYNGNMIVSGAIGIFRKDFLINSKGYTKTVGEDARKTIDFLNISIHNKRKMIFVPNAEISTTFAFSNIKGLLKQQNRWMRALLQVMPYMNKTTKKDYRSNKLKLTYYYYNFIEILMQFLIPLNITLTIYYIITEQFNNIMLRSILIYFIIALIYSITSIIRFSIYQKKPIYLLLLPLSFLSIIYYILIFPSKIQGYNEKHSLYWGR